MTQLLELENGELTEESSIYLETYLEDDSKEFPPSDIVAFNELRSCADIVRMYKSKQLVIDPEFQRGIVWKDTQQTRFIDSLTKQLPIPSMCISLDYKTNKRFVIDGLQRISSIIKFLTDDNWKMSKLDDIDGKISGKTVAEVKEHHKDLYERVENLTIPITVIRYDARKKNHNQYLFTIFHRLNTGGTTLNNQEIRNSIYHGKLNNLLKELVENNDNWRKLFPLKKDKSYRFAREELILRFFAFYDYVEQEKKYKYQGRLTKFLNDYMDINQDPKAADLDKKKEIFTRTVDIAYRQLSENKLLGEVSNVVMEGVLVGIAKNIETIENLSSQEFKERYEQLRQTTPYLKESLSGGLYQKDKPIERIKEAIKILG